MRPVLQLLGIALETTMKADLLLSGTDERQLASKEYGHRLNNLFRDIDSGRKEQAIEAAKRSWIDFVRQARDEHSKKLVEKVGALSELISGPDNKEIAETVPKVQPLMDSLGPLYASRNGLRYFQNLYQGSAILKFPPYADVDIRHLSIFGRKLAESIEGCLRRRINSK